MYSQHPRQMGEVEIQRRMAKYSDLQVRFDPRVGEHGMWTAMLRQVLPQDLVRRDRGGGGYTSPYKYYLTPEGVAFCHSLFTKKLHPDIHPAAPLVTPLPGGGAPTPSRGPAAAP
jgi:hypothetical protein